MFHFFYNNFADCLISRLHPSYIHSRIRELKKDFTLRVLLCLVDLEDNAKVINALTKIAVVNDLSMLLVWSNEEAARK